MEPIVKMNMGYQRDIQERLEATGLVEVVAGNAPVNSNTVAKTEAMRLKGEGVEITIFNYAIWCYPQYTAVAANFAPGPYILFCNVHPSECGMVGMMAAAGTFDQLGLVYERIWGSIRDNDVLKRVMACIRGACGINRLTIPMTGMGRMSLLSPPRSPIWTVP
jgi:L-fucose isomerase